MQTKQTTKLLKNCAIKSVDVYKYPSKEEILFELESISYDKYIPYNFLNDLISGFCFRLILKTSSKNGLIEDSKYGKLVCNFVDAINIDSFKNLYSPLSVAVQALDVLSESVDFRSLESASYDDVVLEFKSKNYIFDIKKLPASVIKYLNITTDQLEGLHDIPDELVKILTFCTNITSKIGSNCSVSCTTKDKLDNFSNIGKLTSFEKVRPDSDYRIALKKSYFKNKSVNITSGKDIIVGFNFNAFMFKESELITKFLVVLAYMCKDVHNVNKSIYIVYENFNRSYIEKFNTSNVEEIVKFKWKPGNFSTSNDTILSFLCNNFKNSNIILFADPKKPISISRNSIKSCTINIVSTNCNPDNNMTFKSIVNKTKGDFCLL